MGRTLGASLFLSCLVFAHASCSSTDAPDDSAGASGGSANAGGPGAGGRVSRGDGQGGSAGVPGQGGGSACAPTGAVQGVAAVLADAANPCRARVEAVVGRAASIVFGSGVVWTRRTHSGTGIVATAAHVMSPCSDSIECPTKLTAPGDVQGQGFVTLASKTGGPPGNTLHAQFSLFNLPIPAAENTDDKKTILPRHDISLYVVDSQTHVSDGSDVNWVPGPVVDAELSLDDPEGLTLRAPTFRAPAPGETALLVGYPAGGPTAGTLSAALADVLDDHAALAAIAALAAAGDEEGTIPYDAEAEVLLRGDPLYAGMSGSGVFNQDGELLGVAVRVSMSAKVMPIWRVVRMTYVVGAIAKAYGALARASQTAVAPYLEPNP